MSFTIPFSSPEEEASVMKMSEGFAIESLEDGSYLMILSELISGKNNGNNATLRDENDGVAMEFDCVNIFDQPLQCRADVPSVDFDLPIIVHSIGSVTLSALTIIPGNTGCAGDVLIIPRTYFGQDANANMDQCMQTFTVELTDPLVLIPPADVLLTCVTDSRDPADTGNPTASGACNITFPNTFPTFEYSDASTQSYPNDAVFTITRTWTVTDHCGRTNSADQIIDIDSSIGCPAAIVPTMGQWGIMILFLSLMIFSIQMIRQKVLLTTLAK